MTSTDTLLPCPFCGGAAEMRGGGMINCQRCGAEAFGPKWQRRTPPTPATEEREAVAQWCSGCHEVRSVDCYRAGCPKSDTERRAAEILAAEANERARIEADLKDPQIVHMNMLRGGIAKINVTQAMHLNGWTSIDNWHRMTVEQIEAAVKARNEHGAGKRAPRV